MSAFAIVGCGGGSGPTPGTVVPEALRGTRFVRYSIDGAVDSQGTVRVSVQENGRFEGIVTQIGIPGNNETPEVFDVDVAGSMTRQADGSYRATGTAAAPDGPVAYVLTLTPNETGEPNLAFSVTEDGSTATASGRSVEGDPAIPAAIRGRITGRLLSETIPDAPVDVNIVTTRLGDFGGTVSFPLGESTTVDAFYGRVEPDGAYTGRTVTAADGSFAAQGSINPADLVMSYSDPDAPEFVAIGTVSVAR